MNFEISAGIIHTAQKVVLYGPEGIGKSTFASQFPDPLFIDTEGSTKRLDVRRLPAPSSWEMLIEEVKYVKENPGLCKTLVIDTADWAERMCSESLCNRYKFKSIENFRYGKGYTFIYEEFGKFLNLLEDVVGTGINVLITAHAAMRKFEQPDEMGAYDRWEMKLGKKVAPIVKEWADMVLFANYQTFVVKQENKMLANKATGGKRVVHTSHSPVWDAKNRHGLPEQIDFSFDEIAHLIPADGAAAVTAAEKQEVYREVPEKNEALEDLKQKIEDFSGSSEKPAPAPAPAPKKQKVSTDIPKELADLMQADNISEAAVQKVVEEEGYYPANTPISKYEPDFVKGWIVTYWDYVRSKAQNVPF